MKRVIFLFPALAIGLLLIAGCSKEQLSKNYILGSTPRSSKVEVVARQFEYVPNRIVISQYQPMRLVVKSVDVVHQMYIPGIKIEEMKVRGSTVEIRFTPMEKGEFPFVCELPCGTGHDRMTGTIVVE